MPLVSKMICLACLATLGVAQAGFAQEFYVGTLVEPMTQDTDLNNADYRGFIGLAGVRVPVNNTFFLAGETEISLEEFTSESLDYENPDRFHRYRAHLGANLSNLSVFIGTTTRELAPSDDRNAFDTLYLNFGVDVSVSDNVTIRFEAIQDSLDPSDGGADGTNDRLRLGTLINF